MFKRKQLKIVGENLLWCWKFNIELIEKFLIDLNIKNRIKIKVWSPYDLGNYGQAFYKNRKHTILISRYLDYHEANDTLLHELFHVHQRECFPTPKDFTMAYQDAGGSYLTAKSWEEYWDNPFEIAAREFAEENKRFAVCSSLIKYDIDDDSSVLYVK